MSRHIRGVIANEGKQSRGIATPACRNATSACRHVASCLPAGRCSSQWQLSFDVYYNSKQFIRFLIPFTWTL